LADLPRILSSFAHGSLKAIGGIDGELGQRVRDQLKSETRELIETCSPISWLPLELDLEFSECFYQVLART
jgi:hypothetical protein